MKPQWLETMVLLFAVTAISAQGQGFKTVGSISVGGAGGWDYLSADSVNRRLYVSHGSEVVVIDLDSQKVLTKISGFGGVHGIFLANDLGKGFITDGRANQVAIFDLKTNQIKNKVQAGTNPDGAVYDPASKRLFAFNGRSSNATVIDGESENVVATIPLDGKPEFPVADGKGHVYVNIEDKSEIVKIDSKSAKEVAKWSLAPCESPSGLAMDAATDRLFSVCDNKMMAVVNAATGKIVGTPAIGEGPDAARFDPALKLAFSSNGESGTLTVIHEDGKDKYSVVENVTTVTGARTMALDEKTHTIYLSSAKYGPPGPNAGGSGRPRPSIIPGTFKLLVVKK
jgi:DNA-binding beta-propeller fold protein YncE